MAAPIKQMVHNEAYRLAVELHGAATDADAIDDMASGMAHAVKLIVAYKRAEAQKLRDMNILSTLSGARRMDHEADDIESLEWLPGERDEKEENNG